MSKYFNFSANRQHRRHAVYKTDLEAYRSKFYGRSGLRSAMTKVATAAMGDEGSEGGTFSAEA